MSLNHKNGQTTQTSNVKTARRPLWVKASFYIPENKPNFSTTKGFRMKISIKLFYQYMGIVFNF